MQAEINGEGVGWRVPRGTSTTCDLPATGRFGPTTLSTAFTCAFSTTSKLCPKKSLKADFPFRLWFSNESFLARYVDRNVTFVLAYGTVLVVVLRFCNVEDEHDVPGS